MTDTQWKYTNNKRVAVVRTNADGSIESHMVAAAVIQKFLAEGGEILSEDAQ